MTDDNIERRLRTERGRFDSGYRAVPLPATLDRPHGTPAFGRLAILLATVVAGAATAIILIALLGAPGAPPIGEEPAVTPVQSASAAPTRSAAPSGLPACTGTDVAVTAERWGGAAGSRGTTLDIALADGANSCALPAQLDVRMASSDGVVLISGLSNGTTDATLPLVPSRAYTLGVAWSNWCGEQPDGAHLELRLDPLDAWITIEAPAGGADPVPPCLGSGQPTALSLTVLEARP